MAANYDINFDYQAEINKLMAQPTKDWAKISELQTARQNKINSNQNLTGLWGLSNEYVQNSLSALNQYNTQTQNQPIPGYQDPYKNYIDTAVTNIRNRPDFNYDMNQDEALKKAMGLSYENSYETQSRLNARRSMQNDSWNQNKAQENANLAAISLIPQFRQQALQEFQTNYGKDTDILNSLAGLKQQDINNILDVSDRYGNLGGIDTVQGKQYGLQERQQGQAEQAQKFEQQQFLDEKEWSRNVNNPDNQLKQLEISAQKIQLSQLPQQVKLQTQQMLNDVAAGKLEPEVMKTQIAQIQSDIAAQGIQNIATTNQAFQTQAQTNQIKQQTTDDYAKMKSIEGLTDEEYTLGMEVIKKVKSGELNLEDLGL